MTPAPFTPKPEEKKLNTTAPVFVPGKPFVATPVVVAKPIEKAPEPEPEVKVESQISKCLNQYIDHHEWEVEDFEKVIQEMKESRAKNEPISLDMLKNKIGDLRICESFDLKN